MSMMLRAPVTGAPASPRILLVAGCQLLGETLQAALTGHGFDVAVSVGATGADTIDEVRARRPGVVVLDLDRTGTGFGRALIRPLIDLGTAVFLIGVTDRLEEAHCLEAGAAGVATKSESFAVMLEKFRRVVGGEAAGPVGDRLRSQRELDDHRRADRRRLAPFESLTPRERDVLAHIVDGRPAAEIARRADVALPTVRTQVRSILQKLEVNSQMAAAAMARNAGWLHPGRPAATGAALGAR
jgi:two-component system, NarL family, nitrate/nitrite response regulator NarL